MYSIIRQSVIYPLLLSFLLCCSGYTYSQNDYHTHATPVNISTCQQLQNISQNLSADYALANDIDCSDSKTWNGGKGFMPINNFSGSLDGQQHNVNNIYINQSANTAVGVFATLTGKVSNINLKGENVTGAASRTKANSYMGGVAALNQGTINTVSADGTFSGNAAYNGVVAGENDGQINSSSGHGQINGSNYTGGLVGYQVTNATTSNCHANVVVIGTASSFQWHWDIDGGLIGTNDGLVQHSYSTGQITSSGTIYQFTHTGGVVGWNQSNGVLTNDFSGSNISGYNVGGLVGDNVGKLTNDYSYGKVTAAHTAGGLVGIPESGSSVTNAYYDTDTSGQTDTGRGTPLHTAQMYQQASYSGWDFVNSWKINEGHDYPKLKWQNASFPIHIQPITSAKTINTPFAITIDAGNPNFNGRVDLTSDRGEVTPTFVTLANGTWTGNISIDYAGKRNRLLLHWEPQNETDTGFVASNSFDVNEPDGTIAANAILAGSVVDADSQKALASVTIKLYSADPSASPAPAPSPLYTGTTDTSGNFTIPSIFPGQYYVTYALAGYQNNIENTQLIVDGTVNKTIQLSQACSSGKVPVLLVPGIMGSTTKSMTSSFKYPRLPKAPNSNNLELMDGPSWWQIIGWKNLEEDLKSEGYKQNCSIFEAPYDWSQSIPTISKTYLQKQIKNAEQKSGSNQVDIIAHSMGGLVVRAYLQTTGNTQNVRKLALVGTPNDGATMPYFIWEGGDPKTADVISGNIGWGSSYFYSNTLNYFMKSRGWGPACDFNEKYEYNTPTQCDEEKIYSYLNYTRHGLSVGELMPIYNQALIDNGTDANRPITAEENSFLKALNSVSCATPDKTCKDTFGETYHFIPPAAVFTSDNTGVQTKLFYATGKDTPTSIHVDAKGDKLYQDGKPTTNTASTSPGDGTVLTSSLKGQYMPSNLLADVTSDKKTEHSDLINFFKIDIASFISGQIVNYTPKPKDTSPVLLLGLDGRVIPSLKATNLQNKNIKSNDNQEQDILGMDHSGIIISQPAAGTYTVNMKSTYADDFSFSINYVDPSDTSKTDTFRFTDHAPNNGNQSYTFTLNPASSPILTPGRNLEPPQNITAQNNDGKIQLVWTDPTGDTNKDVKQYDIYIKAANSPIYTLLDHTTEKSYTTAQPWSDAANDTYVVKAELNTGSATVFSNPTFYDPTP